MSEFRIHWSFVRGPCAGKHVVADQSLCAIWPSPVNADTCFESTGFTDFGDNDDAWDKQAQGLLARLVDELAAGGRPELLTEAQLPRLRWYQRVLGRKASPIEIVEQLLLPIHWDSLPPCRVGFGAHGARLFTGQGHHIYWVALQGTKEADVPDLVMRIADGVPVLNTELRWEYLL